jgi:uncharacterized membrane protein YedE/YeeE
MDDRLAIGGIAVAIVFGMAVGAAITYNWYMSLFTQPIGTHTAYSR